MTGTLIRERLAAYLREQAACRDETAPEHPDAKSADRAAEQFRCFADYVEGLPGDDPYLRALAAVHEDHGAVGVYVPGENARTLLAGLPLTHEMTRPERFLAELIAAEVGDEIDSLRQEAR